MNKPNDLAIRATDPNDIDSNASHDNHFNSILNARLSRRNWLRGSAVTAATAVMGSMGLSACGGDSDAAAVTPTPTPTPEKLLAFTAVPKSLADVVSVPAGYTATALYALGDSLRAATPAYKNDGSDTDFDNRAGDHHDGMEYYGLSAAGAPLASGAERGLLAMNHEATTDEKLSSHFLHVNGGTTSLPRPAAEVDKEVAVHGLSVVEVKKTGSAWATVNDSAFNRRVTPLTDIEIAGPVRGNALVVTKYSPTGTKTRGTINNCGTGKSPWGSYLSGEENWAGYFTRSSTDNAARGDKSVVSLNRYGRSQGGASRHGWETGGSDDKYARWNLSKIGASSNGSDDYRNELNGMGYIVEMDPYDKTRAIRKRTALGRYAHESAAFSVPTVGSTWPSTWATIRATNTSTNSSRRPYGPPPTPTRPTAWPPATNTSIRASCTWPSWLPTARASGSSWPCRTR